MGYYLGELAALTTSLAWSATSTFFTLSGRSVGSVVTNRVRLPLAVVFLAVTHWFLLASPFPFGVDRERLLWLSLSGIIGLVVADACLFQAFVLIGARLSMLMMSMVPVIASAVSWLVLGEQMTLQQMLGVVLTLGGVAWVVMERGENRISLRRDRNYMMGILFGLGGATGQALGLIASKKGLQGEFSALSGTLIRMVVAAAVMWLLTLLQGQAGNTLKRIRQERRAGVYIVGGAIAGPFLGVWLSLVAIQNTQVGIASTLMSLAPICLLPIAHFVFKESISARAILGTLLAISGVAILFMV